MNLNLPSQAHHAYDYIVTGAGCAGLSLVMHLIRSGKFTDKKILLLDKDPKTKNDRTWCFWEKEDGLFQPIVHRQWDRLWFHSDTHSRLLELRPYQYKLIRGIDFYRYCFDEIARHSNITFVQSAVDEIRSNQAETIVRAGGIAYSCQYVFNSILASQPEFKAHHYWLLQHFKGWLIKARNPVFHSSAATLMDFRTNQKDGAAFFYVLPFSADTALVEYTVFSKNLLQKGAYEQELRRYLSCQLGIMDYCIEEEEFGVIPMTNFPFPAGYNAVMNIGTAGGQAKASSGYTFRFIQKQSAAIVQNLRQSGTPFTDLPQKRFHFYDSVFLHVLAKKKLPGNKIFTPLFAKNSAAALFRFLDNESTLREELKIISTLPTGPFFCAAARYIYDVSRREKEKKNI